MTTDILENATIFRTRRVKHLLGELDALTYENSIPGRRLSIYLPAGKMPEDARKARIHFRNAVGGLRDRLSEDGGRSSEVQAFLRSVEEFAHGKEADSRFWNNQLGGIAILCDPNGIRLLEVPKRFRPAMYFSTHWHLAPLLELAANVDGYWLLSLNQNDAKFYRGSRLGIREVELPNTPASLAESETAQAQGHGHDPNVIDFKSNRASLDRFFSRLDAGVREVVKDSSAPLILAGIESYLPLFRKVCSSKHLVDTILPGNAEHTGIDTLHERAREALKSEFQESRKRELLKIRQRMECDLVERGIEPILDAAETGRIASLVAPSDRVCWGIFDPDERSVEILPETDIRGRDLYQQAAELTLLHGGELFYLESMKMPRGGPICASLRY